MTYERGSEFEQVRPATTPEEMRAEILRLSLHEVIVRNVMTSADAFGASDRDRYTALAYYALVDRQRLMKQVLFNLRMSPTITAPMLENDDLRSESDGT